jgi:hypothetical protein
MSRRAAALLVALYLATRLPGLGKLPLFLDESWHVSWAMWIAEGQEWDSPWRFGKGLSLWVAAPLMPLAGLHYAWVSRSVTVLFGLLTPFAVFFAARRLYDRETGIVATLVYLTSPFALMYDRTFLTDPVQSAFGALALVGSLRVAESGRTRDALVLAVWLVLSVLSKVLGVLVFLTPLLVAFLLRPGWRERFRPFAVAVGLAGAVVAYPVIWFVDHTHTVVAALESDAGVQGRLLDNLPQVSEWLLAYWTWPLLALFLVGVASAAIERSRPGLLLAGLVAGPMSAYLFTSVVWFPRYLLFLTPAFSILAAAPLVRGLRAIRGHAGPTTARWLAAVALFLTLLPSLRFDFLLHADPTRAPLPEVERLQFVDGWPSGYGVRDTVAFLQAEVEKHREGVHVAIHRPSRVTTLFALSVAFRYEGWLVIDDLRLDDPASAGVLLNWARQMPTYVVLPLPRRGGRPSLDHLGRLLRPTLETRKPDGSLCDQIYEVCTGDGCTAR